MSTTSSTKKGTKETEVIIGKAAAQLSAAVKGIAEAVKTAENLETVLGDYSLKVTNLKEEIGSLATEYAQKKADTQFNLNLEFKTNEKDFYITHTLSFVFPFSTKPKCNRQTGYKRGQS